MRFLRSLFFCVPALALVLSSTLAQQRKAILREDFNDNNNNWLISYEQPNISLVLNGVYGIAKQETDTRFFWIPNVQIDNNENYTIRVRLRQTSGPIDWGYGVLWGTRDANNVNAAYISSTGFAQIAQWNSGQFKSLVPWRKVSFIRPQGEWNIVEIRKENSAVSVFVNGGFAAYSTAALIPIYGSFIGFVVDSKSSIEVDYITVEQWATAPVREAQGADLVGQRENLGSAINSPDIELVSVISADGRTLYIDRRNSRENIGGANGQSDIWIATRREDGTWNKAVNAGKPLNNEESNSVIAVLPDNNTLLVANQYKPDGSPGGPGVSVAQRIGNTWSVPQPQTIRDYVNTNKYATFNLAPDGKTLLFGIEDDSTYGDSDIYVSFLGSDGVWSKPRNVGPIVNSIGADFGPFMAADGVTMYYTSDGKPGYGRHDIYMTRRLDSTWLHWSEPENLGPNLNTPDWDAYLAIAPTEEYAYLVGSEPNAESDLFRIKLPPSMRPNPVVLVSGKVLNSKTKQPVAARIVYEALSTGSEIGQANANPSDGGYSIALPINERFGVRAEAAGYYPISEELATTGINMSTTLQRNLMLMPIEVGATVRLSNVFFDYNKSELKPESYAELERLVEFLEKNPAIAIEVNGHTDAVGNEAFNKTLSEKRAAAVASYLQTKGISPSRLRSQGYGKTKPVASNDTEEGRQLNRRVEFVIMKL